MSTALAPSAEQELLTALAPLRSRLARHPLFSAVRTLPQLRVFMQSHVYAVWDFMSLLKALQRRLTCVELPWRPTADAGSRRLINEIVLGEESDLFTNEQGAREAVSHFELYLRAMEQIDPGGTATGPVRALVDALAAGQPLDAALAAGTRQGATKIPGEAAAFMRTTFRVISTGDLHRIAAAFTFGREDLIPEMFAPLVRELDRQMPGRVALFRYYLERHIEMDGEEHGPMALAMVRNLCRAPEQWAQAQASAVEALQARLALWDGIHARIEANRL